MSLIWIYRQNLNSGKLLVVYGILFPEMSKWLSIPVKVITRTRDSSLLALKIWICNQMNSYHDYLLETVILMSVQGYKYRDGRPVVSANKRSKWSISSSILLFAYNFVQFALEITVVIQTAIHNFQVEGMIPYGLSYEYFMLILPQLNNKVLTKWTKADFWLSITLTLWYLWTNIFTLACRA